MKKLQILGLLVLWTSIARTQTLKEDLQSQVSDNFSTLTTPLTPVSYTWTQHTNWRQVVLVDIQKNFRASSITKNMEAEIEVQQTKGIVRLFTGLGEGVNLCQIQIDGNVVLATSSATSSAWVSKDLNLATLMSGTPSIGTHLLQAAFTVDHPVLGINLPTVFTLDLTLNVIPDAASFYSDNFGNTMMMWPSNTSSHIPFLFQEGFDAKNKGAGEFIRHRANQLINYLNNNDIDLYIISSANGGQDIRRNAAAYHAAVKYVSSINNNVNIITGGVSMGGIISRYALLKDEKTVNLNGGSYLPVRCWVSMDSPHDGADIDADMQKYATVLRLTSNFITQGNEHDFNLESLAARQMLNFNATQIPNMNQLSNSVTIAIQQMGSNVLFAGDVHGNFYEELNSLTPTGISNRVPMIAVSFSNGSPNPDLNKTWMSINPPNAITSVAGQTTLMSVWNDLYGINSVPATKDFGVSGNLALAGSKITKTMVSDDIIAVPVLKDVEVSRYEDVDPTFITYQSALLIKDGESKFCIPKFTKNVTSTRHDQFPAELIKSMHAQLTYDLTQIPVNSEYNFHENTATHIPLNLSVEGTMYVNNGSVASGGQPALSNSHFDCWITCPASNVTVQNGGEIEIGDPSVNNTGTLIVQRSVVLDIKNNGTIIVNEGSNLVIEYSGILKFNQGAKIILNGPNAVLHIKGRLELAPGATFEVVGGAAGKGYIIWENSWGDKHKQAQLISDATNTFKLSSGGTPANGNLALICKGNIGFMTGWALGKLEVKNCRINLDPESRIVTECGNTEFEGVEVYGNWDNPEYPNFMYKLSATGIHVLGRPNSFKNVHIYKCVQGIKHFNVGTHEPLRLEEVYFTDCRRGVLIEGGRIIYNGGNFTSYSSSVQGIAAVEGIGTQGINYFTGVGLFNRNNQSNNNVDYKFKVNEYNSNLKAHGTGQFNLLNCNLSEANKSVELDQGMVRPVCSWFDLNKTGISLVQNATFNVTNRTYNSFNFENPGPGGQNNFVKGYQNAYLFLDKAENAIQGANYGNTFMDIVLHPKHNWELSNATNCFHPINQVGIMATNNYWKMWNGNETDLYPTPTVMTVPVSSNVNLQVVVNGAVSGLDILTRPSIDNMVFEINKSNTCPIYMSNKGWKNLDPPPTNWIADQGNPYLGRTATLRSSGFVKFRKSIYELNDDYWPQFLDECKVWLDTNIEDSSAEVFHTVYTDVQSVYPELFTDPKVTSGNKTQLEQICYNKLLDMQQNLISRSSQMDQVQRFYRFELHRDLALIHRAFNHRQEGINHLNMVIPTFSNPKDQEALLAWVCILEHEQLYLDSVIPYDSLRLYPCIPNYYFDDSTHNFVHFGFEPWLYETENNNQSGAPGPQGMVQIPVGTISDKETKSGDSKLFPNPAENSYTIMNTMAIKNVIVRDNTGRLIDNITVNNQNSVTIDALKYAKGIYFVKVYCGDRSFVHQLLINK